MYNTWASLFRLVSSTQTSWRSLPVSVLEGKSQKLRMARVAVAGMVTCCIIPLSPSASGLAVQPSSVEYVPLCAFALVTWAGLTPQAVHGLSDPDSKPPFDTALALVALCTFSETSSRHR